MKNEIICALKFDARAGSLSFKGVRYMLIRPETVAALQIEMEKLNPRACAAALYEAGRTGGYLSSKKYREVFNYTPAQTARFMAKMGSQIGWGRFVIKKLDVKCGILIAEVINSPFAVAYKAMQSQQPRIRNPKSAIRNPQSGVCHVIRGIFGGMAQALFEKPVKVVETKCLAKGDRLCRFETR